MLDGIRVLFPFESLYREQYDYMFELKQALDAPGHALLEMPTGTGKTVALLSLILSYFSARPSRVQKLIYCTRYDHVNISLSKHNFSSSILVHNLCK